jgi:CubicO group peptidase (beta-lactamase class C family)
MSRMPAGRWGWWGRGSSLALGLLCVFPAPGRADDLKARIDAVVGPFLKDRKYLGLAVGVVQPAGRRAFGYGHVTLAGKEVVPDESTVFEIGSITKVFTGLLLADLVREGVVKLDDPAQKHLPKELHLPKRGDREITLLDLATHTSGLPVQPTDLLGSVFKTPLADWGNPYAHYGLAELGKNLAAIKLERDPGGKYAYSNLGAGVLGHALVHAARASSYDHLLVRRITGPLGMRDTLVRLNTEQQERKAPGHGRWGEASAWDFASCEGCGGIRSTVHDMLWFAAASLGRPKTDLLPSMRLALEPRRDTGTKDRRIGLFWHTLRLPGGGPEVLWHNGGTGGYRSFLGLVPPAGTAVVVLSNSDKGVEDIALEILKLLDDTKGSGHAH